jgi:HD-GYP domain-containing protein (c-di-GMP phosphodiesterase class II)
MNPTGPSRETRTRRRAFPLHIHLVTLFGVLLALTVVTVSAFHASQTRRIILAAHQQRFAQLSATAVDTLEQTRDQVSRAVDLLSRSELAWSPNLNGRLGQLELLHEILRLDPAITRLLVGYTGGDQFIVRRLPTGETLQGAPPDARVAVDSVERERGRPDHAQTLFYSAYLQPLGTTTLEEAADPRLVDWYREAINRDEQVAVMEPPQGGSRPAVIFARRSSFGRSVVAAEVRLARLGEAVSQLQPTPSAWVALLAQGLPIYQHGGGEIGAALAAQAEGMDAAAGQATVTVAGSAWLLFRARLPALAAPPFELVLAVPETELFAEADTIKTQTLWISLGLLLFTVPVTWYASRMVSRPLRQLAREARAVQEFRFPADGFGHSIVKEVDELGHSLGAMQSTIHRFLDTGRELSSEFDPTSLIRDVLEAALKATDLTSGALYLLSQDESRLEPVYARRGGESLVQPTAAGFQALAVDAESDLLAALKWLGEPQPIIGGLSRALHQELPLAPGPAGKEAGRLLAQPLREPKGSLIGAVWLHLPRGAPTPRADQLAFLQALGDVAAIALQNHRLLRSRKALLEAVVAVVAGAIDAKSPHTGGHCQRVPVLLEMLAEAACRADRGPFAHFQLDAAGWEALRMAGWLHDCGKVTTPEYVIDKATKLETLYNRLHEVRMRFEVIKRDTELAHCREALGRRGSTPEMEARLAQALAELDEEFATVARCNLGAESLSDADRERLRRIGHRTWQRTMDDRLGLSWEELSRKPTPSIPLPATESLLADKPEHLIPHHNGDCYAPGNAWGFRVVPPPHRLNLGELHNLEVGRGTLTAEERHLINDHIVQSIIMLSRLPFPPELARVLEIAGGHHERMNGQGYPRRLSAAELSIPARMLALADVFEALTAGDRPYKRGKTVAEAVAMLRPMAESGHLDKDVLELALRYGVFERYAERFLGAKPVSARGPIGVG